MQTAIEQQEGEAMLLSDPRREGRLLTDLTGTQTVQHSDEPSLPTALRVAAIAAIQQDAAENYMILRQKEHYEARNAQHALHATFFPVGVELTALQKDQPWQWGMQLLGYGYGERRERLVEAVLKSQGNRIEYQRDTLTEWYLNGPLGLEQGFTLHTPPGKRQADESLVLDIEVQSGWTLELAEDRQHLTIKQVDGTHVLHYGHLYVQDAKERFLPVHLEVISHDASLPQQIRIDVDDRDAVYPLIIDPLIQQGTKLLPSDGYQEYFGQAVAISGNTVAIGAYGADVTGITDAGAVYIFTFDGTTWTQQAKLVAADPDTYDRLGFSVAISGDTVIAGRVGNNKIGAAYIFVRSGTTWSQQQKISASDGIVFDSFGVSVGIDGNTVIVGATDATVGVVTRAGAAYVFTRSGTTWTQQQKLTEPTPTMYSRLGAAVAISIDTAIVRRPYTAPTPDSVYVFVRSGTTWTQQQLLTIAGNALGGQQDTKTIAISGNTVVIGAGEENTAAGAAYVFTRSGTTWTQQQKLTASDAASNAEFGYSVTISNNSLIIGARGRGLIIGAAYVFARNGSLWTQQQKLTASDSSLSAEFGTSVGLTGNVTIIGAQGIGAAYTFSPLAPAPSPNSGATDNSLSWAGEVIQDGLVALRTGEKIETATDMVVYTPVGEMDFTRTYRQSKRSIFQFMGLGWQHSHAPTLVKTTGTPNTLLIQMPNGGELKLTESAAGSNHYVANTGSDAVVDYNTGSSQYTLTGSDRSTYVFNVSGKLITRTWPPFGTNGEKWNYAYDGNGRLSSVDDNYTNGRKLTFAYVNNPGQYNDGQLWRMGDQDTTNLTGTPVGRYVEFGYTPQKNNGVTIASPKPLLNTVRDVRGNIWTYRYYGQTAGETNANQLDFLIEITSPSVDTTGDGTADGTLSLEQLSYTTSGSVVTNLTQNLGNSAINTAYAFQPGGQNVTTETVAGKVGTHYFNNGVYGGFQDTAGNINSQAINFQYRPEIVQDANAQQSQLIWSADGKFLQTLTDALGRVTTYSYNTSGASADTLDYILDAEGRKTQYLYGDSANPLLPTAIKFFDTNGTTVLRWQAFGYDSHGRMTIAKLLDPANGTTVMQEIDRTYYSAAGAGTGLLQTEVMVDPITPANNSTTTFTYDNKGRVIKTQKTSLFGCCKFTYKVYDEADHVVAAISSDISQTPPTTKSAAIALYDAANPDKNRVTTYDYDTLGRRVLTTAFDGAGYAVKELTAYDALGRVMRSIANYVASGSILNPYTASKASFSHGSNTDQNRVTDNFYNSRGMLRKQIDPLDNVTLYGYDDAGRLVKTVRNAATPNYNNDYSGTLPDPTLASYSASSNADQDIVTTQTYDKAGNLVKTVDAASVISYTVYDALNRPVKVVRAAKDSATITLNIGDGGYTAANDPRSASYLADAAPDRDLIETTEYDKMGRVIRTQRLLENRATSEWETTLYGYDGLGRSVKVIKVASSAAYNMITDPSLASYSASSAADQDIITRTAYDKAERVMYTEDNFGQKTWTGYDGLGRPVKNVVNAVGTASDGSASDPRSSSYSPNSAVDKDLILVTVYNSDGRVQSVTDALGRISRYVYDTVGRITRSVQNFVDPGQDPSLWVYNNGWKKSDGTTVISNGTDNDQNIVSSALYDGKGRAVQSIDHRNNVTLTVYDTLDRVVMTIANYVVQGSSQPANWIWSVANSRWENGAGTAIAFGTDNDQNRITTLTYDLLGRVLRMRDAAGIETRYTVDLLGRRTQTIASYVDGSFNGAFPDEDLISSTIYNKTGQVTSTIDVRGTQTTLTYDKFYRLLTLTRAAGTALSSLTYTCYDKAGRIQRTIQNWSNTGSPDAKDGNGNWSFVPSSNGSSSDTDLTLDSRFDKASRPLKRIINYRAQGSTNPSNWIWSTANSRWENGAGAAITFGSNTDQNLINLMSYYKNGQVESTTDAEGVVAKVRYDLLRRPVRQVQAWVDQTEDPALWVWDATDIRWEKSTGNVAIVHGTNTDQNIIQDMTYDKGSRMLTQRNPRGNLTTLAYDKLDRRKSLTNPLSKVWATAYTDLVGAGVRTTTTHPGITGASNYTVQQDRDRLGRLLSVTYGNPANTPDVKLGYDAAGNRAILSEYSAASFSSKIRETQFSYDKLHRMSSAAFDNDGNGSIDETASYQYDAGGLRTRLTLPGSLNVTYTYDARGRLISLTDWDSQQSQMAYDLADRHLTTTRANQLKTEYQYDAGNRVRLLKHTKQGVGSFPTDGMLDNFNRADSASLGSNWGAFSGYSNLDLNGNQCRNPATAGTTAYAGNYYNAAQYGPDCENYLTLAARPTDGAYMMLRVGGTLSTPNAYAFGLNSGGSGVHSLLRVDSGLPTPLGATFSQALAVGDSIGISAVGSTLSAYYKPSGGNWTLLASRTDSTYSSAGYLAVASTVGGWKADDFSGGTVSGGIAVNTLAHFEYVSDKRGNRIQALEVLANPTTASNTTIAATDKGLALTGTWSTVSGFKESTDTSAILKLIFLSNLATLTMGKGPDHSQYDLYIDGVFWQTVDGYAASATQVDITIPTVTLVTEGPHILEVRNKNVKNGSSSGFKARFKQLLVTAKTWTQQNIQYSYDKLARVLEARYCPGLNLTAVDADLQRRYLYTYDRMHNRLTESLAINGGSPTVKTLTYNAANQISSAGYAYDNNGNLTGDGTNSYTWDRANRLLSMGSSSYKYDGAGNRIQQTVGANVSKYLLDLNSSLPTVLSETIGANVTRFVHGLRGLHQLKTSGGAWEHILTDALGSLRVVTNNSVAVLESRNYGVYGDLFGTTGTSQTSYGYAGEPTDGNGLVYDRARYMSPALGQFVSLDPMETFNRYAYVDGNPVMRTDPSGLLFAAGSNVGGALKKQATIVAAVNTGATIGTFIGGLIGGSGGAIIGKFVGAAVGAVVGTVQSVSKPVYGPSNSITSNPVNPLTTPFVIPGTQVVVNSGSGTGSSNSGGTANPTNGSYLRSTCPPDWEFAGYSDQGMMCFNGSRAASASALWEAGMPIDLLPGIKQNILAPILLDASKFWDATFVNSPWAQDIQNHPLIAKAFIGIGLIALASIPIVGEAAIPVVAKLIADGLTWGLTSVAGTVAVNVVRGNPENDLLHGVSFTQVAVNAILGSAIGWVGASSPRLLAGQSNLMPTMMQVMARSILYTAIVGLTGQNVTDKELILGMGLGAASTFIPVDPDPTLNILGAIGVNAIVSSIDNQKK